MQLGLMLRNYGPAATPDTLRDGARRAEAAGLDVLWVADHVAIPPDQSEGSGGLYVEPLVTLAHLAAVTQRIHLGTGVLVLPHRAPLAAAKAIASVQYLSSERLRLGIGVGAMEAEYRVTGVDWSRRGAIVDDMLDFLNRCFAADEVEENGQRFIFKPRPVRPPIYIGGVGPHAYRRIARYGDGWIAPRSDPAHLAEQLPILAEAMEAHGRPVAKVVALAALDLDDPPAAIERALALKELGLEGISVIAPYKEARDLARIIDRLAGDIAPRLRT